MRRRWQKRVMRYRFRCRYTRLLWLIVDKGMNRHGIYAGMVEPSRLTAAIATSLEVDSSLSFEEGFESSRSASGFCKTRRVSPMSRLSSPSCQFRPFRLLARYDSPMAFVLLDYLPTWKWRGPCELPFVP